jgi:hypothetical protein
MRQTYAILLVSYFTRLVSFTCFLSIDLNILLPGVSYE